MAHTLSLWKGVCGQGSLVAGLFPRGCAVHVVRGFPRGFSLLWGKMDVFEVNTTSGKLPQTFVAKHSDLRHRSFYIVWQPIPLVRSQLQRLSGPRGQNLRLAQVSRSHGTS